MILLQFLLAAVCYVSAASVMLHDKAGWGWLLLIAIFITPYGIKTSQK